MLWYEKNINFLKKVLTFFLNLIKYTGDEFFNKLNHFLC